MPQFASRDEYLAWKASQGEGGTAEPSAAAPALVGTAPAPKQGAFSGVPPWAWVFVVGCIAIPIVSMGGALPGAMGGGGAAICASLSKNEQWSLGARVLACAAVTGGAWMGFLALIAALSGR